MNKQNTLFLLDVSTTQNKNEFPIQVCFEKFSFDKTEDSTNFNFNIVPDEAITPAAEIQTRISKKDFSIEKDCIETLEGLRKICGILTPFRYTQTAPVLFGYNLSYDIRSICNNVNRLLGNEFEWLESALQSAKRIDVMEMATKLIPGNMVGNSYTMLNVAVCLYGLKIIDAAEKTNLHGSAFDNWLCHKIFEGLISLMKKVYPNEDQTTLDGVLAFINKPIIIKTFYFGKYAGKTVAEVVKIDPDYVKYVLSFDDITEKHKDLVYTLKTQFGLEPKPYRKGK